MYITPNRRTITDNESNETSVYTYSVVDKNPSIKVIFHFSFSRRVLEKDFVKRFLKKKEGRRKAEGKRETKTETE